MRQLRGKTETRRFLQEAATEHFRQRDLVILLQDWEDPYNVGGVFRVADACGAGLVLTGRTPQPPHPQIAVTSLGNHRRVHWTHYPRHDDAIQALREQNYPLIAVEVADQAVPYTEFEFPTRLALVLGSERKGLYPNVLKACASAVYIPMAGKGRSLNVHVAAAVVAFHALLVAP